MLLPVKNMAGDQTGEIELSDAVFGAPVNNHLMHQALVRQLSNARLGTHKTKTRSEVRGGGRKPWRQKGTGRARQGSIRAPQWVGGGTVFGPRPRQYIKRMPKKMHRAALRSALTVKASAGQIVILDELSMDQPKTKAIVAMLTALDVGQESVLLVLAEQNETVQRSANNLPSVKTILGGYLNIQDLLGYDWLVMAREAAEWVEAWLDVEPLLADAAPVVSTTVSTAEAVTEDDAQDGAQDGAEMSAVEADAASEDTTASPAAALSAAADEVDDEAGESAADDFEDGSVNDSVNDEDEDKE